MRIKSVGIALSVLASASPAWAAERTVTLVNNATFNALVPTQLSPDEIKFTYSIDYWKEFSERQPIASKELLLYPGFSEATYWSRKDGQVVAKPEPLLFYQTRTRTILNTPLSRINLKSVIQYSNIKKMVPDLQFAPAPITNAQLVATYLKNKQPQQAFKFCGAVTRQNYEINLDQSQPPANVREPWCSNPNRATCFEACFTLASGILGVGIDMLNKTQPEDGQKDKAEGIQAEVRYFVNEAERGNAKGTFNQLTNVGTDVGGLIELNIFYLNQIIQYAKVITILQADPNDANRTIMTNLVNVAVKSHSWKVTENSSPNEKRKNEQIQSVLKGTNPLVNKDLMGNQQRGLLGGVPQFTQDLTKDLARLLETNHGS